MLKYKGLLLDIDNTLYNYNFSHEKAIKSVFEFCFKTFNLDKFQLKTAYIFARGKVRIELASTASSHNRLLYFQKMLEILNLNPLKYSLELYNIYWDNFLENIFLFDGVKELFSKYNQKICLVTDLTAHIQHSKVQKFSLDNYCDLIVTSEEVGHEKPHPYIFMRALQKLGLTAKNVCMIGDNFEKDVMGANDLGIDSVWCNHENKKHDYKGLNITEVKSFKEILELV